MATVCNKIGALKQRRSALLARLGDIKNKFDQNGDAAEQVNLAHEWVKLINELDGINKEIENIEQNNSDYDNPKSPSFP